MFITLKWKCEKAFNELLNEKHYIVESTETVYVKISSFEKFDEFDKIAH